MDKRRFHRVKCHSPGELVHSGMKYACRLENISLRGALISANECIMVPLGETCTLSVPLEEEGEPLVITAVVVHSFFSMVGIQFLAFCGDAEYWLLDYMRRTTTEPEKLMEEWGRIVEERKVVQDRPPAAASVGIS